MRLLTAIPLLLSAALLPTLTSAYLAAADPVQAGEPGPPVTETPATSPQPGAAQAPGPTLQSSTTPSAIAAENKGLESVVVRAEAVDLDQIICKEVPPRTGSRLGGGRECHSQREWNRVQKESQDITRHQQRMYGTGR